MNEIRIKRCDIGYCSENNVVLKKVNLDLKPGNIYALVGSNGAGKSTLINSMIGILQPFSGKITINLTTKKHPHFSQIGFCPQFPLVDWYTKSFDNILLGPLLAGKSLRESKEASKKFAKLLGIYQLKDKPMDHISGGQQQRVQLARELAKEPSVYLLDEPTTGLDVETSEKLFRFLKQKADQGAIVLVSSHDLTIIEEFANKLIFLDKGRIQFKGDMDDFISKGKASSKIKITLKSASFKGEFDDLNQINVQNDGSLLFNEDELSSVMETLNANHQEIGNIEIITPTLREMYLKFKEKEHTNESKEL